MEGRRKKFSCMSWVVLREKREDAERVSVGDFNFTCRVIGEERRGNMGDCIVLYCGKGL